MESSIASQFNEGVKMLFSSMAFIYVFLPLTCLFYFLAKNSAKNYILLAASLIFYGWGEPSYLAIMLCTIIINYCAAMLVDKHRKIAFYAVLFAVIANLSILGYFKYFNFFVENINLLTGGKIDFIKVVMPIGISFYTFQALSYVIDVYRKEVPCQYNFYDVALYITLFPQLVAGPIVKYHDVAEQITRRECSLDLVSKGIERFIIGLGKKVLIANNLGIVADKTFALPAEQVDTLTSWIGALAYSLQLFFDFAGYSDMAIGLGLIFGFKFLENFNYPYIASSITDFWRRWHISLFSWLKLYLYIPLGGNRVSKGRNCFNLLAVFFVTGFWHGASWTFILWGMWHGVLIVAEKLTGWHKQSNRIVLRVTKHAVTLFFVLIGWVMFRAATITYCFDYLKNMFGFIDHSRSNIVYGPAYYFDNLQILAFFVGLICSTPVFKIVIERYYDNVAFRICYRVALLALLIISTMYLAANTYNPFIYFRF